MKMILQEVAMRSPPAGSEAVLCVRGGFHGFGLDHVGVSSYFQITGFILGVLPVQHGSLSLQ
jgi:hypothetical protein